MDPGVGIGAENQVGAMELDEIHEVGEDGSIRPMQPSLATVQDFDAENPATAIDPGNR